jgi:hypothetical protein
MESKLSRVRDAWWKAIESNGLLAVGFAVMTATGVMLVGQFLTADLYVHKSPPWPIEHFFWTALIAAGIAALIGWFVGVSIPADD